MSTYTPGSQALFPFGLREMRVVVSTTNKALSPSQTCQLTEVLAQAELHGDDAVAAVHAYPIKVEGKISVGGMPLAAYALITGRTIGTAGATPTRTSTLPIAKGDTYPYFTLYGRAVTEDGGDVWVVLYKCKLMEGMGGQFEYGNFRNSDLSFTAVPDSDNSDKIWDIVSHETAAALPTS